MALNAGRITIVGCGPGSPDYLTAAALRAIDQADVLAGSKRLMDSFGSGSRGRERILVTADVDATLARLAESLDAGRDVTVLVSGDPGVFSLARNIIARFGCDRCTVVAGVSSVQVAFARLGLDWADARIVSVHGRSPVGPPEQLGGCDKIAILAGAADAMRWCASAAAALANTHAAFLCENLTLPDERVRPVTAAELSAAPAASLAIVLLVRKELV